MSFRKCLFALSAMFALAAPARSEPPPERSSPRPAIWLLADEDTKIYLFGTVHVLPANLVWRSAAIDRVIEESDELVVEITQSDSLASAELLQEAVLLGKDLPLVQRVSPERRRALRRLTEQGLPVEYLDGLQTWAAAMMLGTGAPMGPDGWTKPPEGPPSGVEDVLESEFSRRGKPISGVETPRMHVGFLSGLPHRAQIRLLEQTIDSIAASAEASAPPGEAEWLTGDVDALAATMDVFPPEIFEVLLTRRNRAWTDWLIERLRRPGTVLFAVGAGHLAGRDSVQSMLETRGQTVTRLE